VRSGHRRPGDVVRRRGRADPGRGDAGAGGEDVDDRAVVGEARAGVADRGCADGDGGGDAGGRRVGGVGVGVTGGDSDVHAVGDERGDSAVEGGVGRAAEGEGGNGRTASRAGLRGDVVEAGDDVGVCARASIAQDLDGDEADALGDTVLRPTDGAGNMSAMTVAVGVSVTTESGTLFTSSMLVRYSGTITDNRRD
jgi:hypothetical protein